MSTTENETDVIVIGGGAAGSVLAARLSEDPACSVVLLEAGGENDDPRMAVPADAPTLWHGSDAVRTTPAAPQAALGGRSIPMITGTGLGGGSAVNALSWLQGLPSDYDGWAAGGATGWAWSDVEPVFRAIEDHELGFNADHGSNGPMVVTTPRDLDPIAMALIQSGIEHRWPFSDDLNGTSQRSGISVGQSNIRDGRRHSVVDGYLNPARGRQNLAVHTRTRVLRILFDRLTAIGVVARDEVGVEHEIRARRGVVLAAGALHTPQLMMLSGIGPAEHLTEFGITPLVDLPAVGAGLQDHPAIGVPFRRRPGGPAPAVSTDDLYRLARRGPKSTFAQMVATLATAPFTADPDALPDCVIAAAIPPVNAPADGMPGLCLTGLIAPESRGSVRLTSADPLDDPAVDQNYLSTPGDRERMRSALRMTLELFDSAAVRAAVDPLGPIDSGSEDSVLDDYLDAGLSTYFHPIGTAAMGSGPSTAVSPSLAVHGTSRLWVADASVMPRITRGHTQAPTIMIAERAARMIGLS